jgi:hypothetical protein
VAFSCSLLSVGVHWANLNKLQDSLQNQNDSCSPPGVRSKIPAGRERSKQPRSADEGSRTARQTHAKEAGGIPCVHLSARLGRSRAPYLSTHQPAFSPRKPACAWPLACSSRLLLHCNFGGFFCLSRPGSRRAPGAAGPLRAVRGFFFLYFLGFLLFFILPGKPTRAWHGWPLVCSSTRSRRTRGPPFTAVGASGGSSPSCCPQPALAAPASSFSSMAWRGCVLGPRPGNEGPIIGHQIGFKCPVLHTK